MPNKAQWDDLSYHHLGMARALISPEYRSTWPHLANFLAESREERSPSGLLALQAKMGRELRALQQSVRDMKRISNQQGRNIDPRNPFLEGARRSAYVIKEIADGIAWRASSFNRSAISILSLNHGGGPLSLSNTVRELRGAAEYAVASKNVTVLNDLTYVLTYGDWTGFGNRGEVFIGEDKGGSGSRKSGRSKTQSTNRRRALQLLEDGEGYTKYGASVIFKHAVKPRTYLGTVLDAIDRAKTKGSVHERLSDYVAIDVWNMRLAIDEGARFSLHDPFAGDRQAVTLSNLLYFDKLEAKPAPYSIFPFPHEDCLDLMTGAIALIGHFDLAGVFQLFKQKMLYVQRPPEDWLRHYLALDIGSRRRVRDGLSERITHFSRPGTMLMGSAAFSRLFFEFLCEDSLLEMEAEVFEAMASSPNSVAIFSDCPEEGAIWR